MQDRTTTNEPTEEKMHGPMQGIDFMRELAKEEPTVSDPENPPYCFFCGGESRTHAQYDEGRTDHHAECLWTRAVAYLKALDS